MELSEQLQETLDALKAPDRESILQNIATTKVMGKNNNNPDINYAVKAIKDESQDLDEVKNKLIPWLQVAILRAKLRHKH